MKIYIPLSVLLAVVCAVTVANSEGKRRICGRTMVKIVNQVCDPMVIGNNVISESGTKKCCLKGCSLDDIIDMFCSDSLPHRKTAKVGHRSRRHHYKAHGTRLAQE